MLNGPHSRTHCIRKCSRTLNTSAPRSRASGGARRFYVTQSKSISRTLKRSKKNSETRKKVERSAKSAESANAGARHLALSPCLRIRRAARRALFAAPRSPFQVSSIPRRQIRSDRLRAAARGRRVSKSC
eukprot:5425245-Pleurochrysis_carterae.AAC.4